MTIRVILEQENQRLKTENEALKATLIKLIHAVEKNNAVLTDAVKDALNEMSKN